MFPWVSVWLSPRSTIRQVVSENPCRALWWLASIYGFSSLLNAFQSMMLGDMIPVLGILILAALLSPLMGYVFFSIWSAAISFTGKWLKGQGTYVQVRAAYAWSCVPLLLNIPLWLILAFFFGRSFFANFAETHLLTQSEVSLLFLVLILRITAAIWSLVLYINMLAEVQSFSILRSIGNILLSTILVSVVFLLIGLGISALVHGTPEPAKSVFQFFQDNSLRYL